MLTEEEKNAGLTGRIIPINIEEQMKSAYIDYSMSVIVSRAQNVLQGSVCILCGQPGQHGDLLRHRLAAEGKVCHLAGGILHIFQIFDQLAVLFVLAQDKHFPVHTGGAHPGDLVQQQLAHGVRHIALAGEQDAAAAVHPQHQNMKSR